MKIVIIGNGPAAVKASEAIATCGAASNKKELKITIISYENTAPYSPMFLADYLTGELGEEKTLLRDDYGLSPDKLLGQRVVKVEDSRNKVVTERGQEISYDKLLIASGASPLKPPIKGIDKEGVYFFNRLDDAKRLSQQTPGAENAIIIGAGVIGVEAAIALNRIGRNVLVIELLGQILPQILDEALARHVENKLTGSGIRFMLGEGVSEITGGNRAAGVIAGDKEISADLILVAVGVKPNIGFLKSSGVKVNEGVLVDEKMRTNVPNIFAAGDVAESINPYGGYELAFNWYNAIDQGWTAGCNLIGIENTYRASPGLVALKGMEPPVISIGRRYGENYEVLSCANKEKGVYEKISIKDNHIDCYQAIGIVDKVGLMYGYIKERKDIGNIKDALLDIHSSANLVA
ncbi:MAG: NAD(P)/FAD-dependent oxidoreductase [Deltaproteobacteria bacterium]|nr:NAD(P)/FAD-dependent oxidoreductase [Deltaproteobacteria bacterium]